MSDERESLRRELAEAEGNLRLIRERKAAYVLEVEVPLQLVKEERRLAARIAELREALGLRIQEREGGDGEPLAGGEARRAKSVQEANLAEGVSTVVGRVLWPFIRYFWLALLALVGLTSGFIQIRQTESWKPIVIALIAFTGVYALIMILRDRMIREGRERREAEALRQVIDGRTPRSVGRALLFLVNTVRYSLILIFLAGMAGIWMLSNRSLEFRLDRLPVTAMAADPANSGTLYAATLGGLHKTTNAGLSWDLLANEGALGFGNLISALSVDPNDSNTVYAATSIIYQSRDAGHMWQALSVPSKGAITQITVAADDSKKIYAVVFEDGILKSTDSGQSWYAVNKGIDDLRVTALAVDPRDSERLYAAADQMYVSTNGGGQWSKEQFGADQRFVSVVAISPSPPHVVMAAGCGFFMEPLWAGAVYKRDFVQGEWQVVGAPDGCETEEFRARAAFGCIEDLVFDPKNSDRVFAATWPNQLYKTLDGGQTWEGLEWATEGNPKEAVLDPDNHDRLFVATTRGVWEVRSEDVADPAQGIYPRYWAISRSDGLGTGVIEGALREADRYRKAEPISFYLVAAGLIGAILLAISVVSLVIAGADRGRKWLGARLRWKSVRSGVEGVGSWVGRSIVRLGRSVWPKASDAVGALRISSHGEFWVGSVLLATALLCTAVFLVRVPRVQTGAVPVDQELVEVDPGVWAYWACNRGLGIANNVRLDVVNGSDSAVLTPNWRLRCGALTEFGGWARGVYEVETQHVEGKQCEQVFVGSGQKLLGVGVSGQALFEEQSAGVVLARNPVQVALMILTWAAFICYLFFRQRLIQTIRPPGLVAFAAGKTRDFIARRWGGPWSHRLVTAVVILGASASIIPLAVELRPHLTISRPNCGTTSLKTASDRATASFVVSNFGLISAHGVYMGYEGNEYQFEGPRVLAVDHSARARRVGTPDLPGTVISLGDIEPGGSVMLFATSSREGSGGDGYWPCGPLKSRLVYQEQQLWALIRNHAPLVGATAVLWGAMVLGGLRTLGGRRGSGVRDGWRRAWVGGMLMVIFAMNVLVLAVWHLIQ